MSWRDSLHQGLVIPAHPLCLTAERTLDEPRQRALTRYYLDSGAGGVAVGVHTTQFEIREHGLLRPVLELAALEAAGSGAVLIAGVCGPTAQALREAALARDTGYHAGLLSLAALRDATLEELIQHVQAVSKIIPVFGFYLQPAVGGRILPHEFWKRFCAIENLCGIKVAPFHRYQTLDVVRAVAESGRENDIALYTGNDDNIVADLLTPFTFGGTTVRFAGGLLGQWAVGTRSAVQLLRRIHEGTNPSLLLALGAQLTDLNAALFDVANGFRGCIAGIHEVLVRQGRMAGRWTLNPREDLSPGQSQEIDRVLAAYPHLLE
ncbi:dihydrodipicolinate synthase family protein [Paludibaculum fermentans]|uniref:Dihydrodipicolinate synthase family protein n=1 Tax=Paludibaculum fermentans TaxID=1473598 RepID=A0A7S7NNS2_PALFE|nr:dihydrodipicolinate synthase family protein [Paludibaculum fermentans]QOY86940.1 dihydrodipicolinate synthase family protein [Paludibaculum fermentans]